MTTSDWTQYDSEESVHSLSRMTRGGKSRKECLELLQAARNSNSFLEHVETLIEEKGGKKHEGKPWPKFQKLNESEFKNIPRKIHGKSLWNAMSDMSPIDACRPGLWLYGTLHAIREGVIESHYLAAGSNGNNDNGLAKIDAALMDAEINKDKESEKQTPLYLETTRQILRRAYGAISERGQKGIFTDVPFAKIWWQHYLAEQIAQSAKDILADDISDIFFQKKFIYSELTMRMSSNLTVLGDVPVRDGLMHFIIRADKNQKQYAPDNFKLTKDDFELLIKRLGIMLSWRAMGTLSASENSKITHECADEISRKDFGEDKEDETAAGTPTEN